jgi:NodT family efflux transporter outer membrane factor (OMF) lipoprotein
MTRWPATTTIVLVAFATTGCLPHQPVANPRAPIDLPEDYAETAGDEAEVPQALPERWWVAFGDPELVALVDLALDQNFQLGAAWARVEQAEAVVEGASSSWWPQISAQLDVARRRQVAVFGALGRQEFENNALGLSVPVSYELDLWNRVGAQVAASGIDVLATRDDFEALALTVAANVVETWLNLVQQRALGRLLDEQLETNRVYAELVTLRFAHGLASALDVFQQRQQVAAIEAQVAQIGGSETVARQQLAVLIGRPPGALGEQIGQLPEPTVLPPLPPLPETGIPAHLLLRRPDVRAARRRVEAADWRVGAAIADQFPQLRFSASIGLSSPTLEDLLGSFVWSLAGSLLAPILDGGRRAAEVRRNRAVVQERLQQFAQTLLNAMLEVESALAQERQAMIQIESLETQLEAGRSALQESRRRYAEGLSDYLPVLTALVSVQRLEQSVLATQRAVLSQRVQLARALGGTWTAELERPALPMPEPADEEDQ